MSDPPDLFDWAADARERARVYGRIAPVIVAYARDHAGEAFHAEDLRRHVIAHAPEIAPASADRILRLLRQEGRLDYVVVNRRASLYRWQSLMKESR